MNEIDRSSLWSIVPTLHSYIALLYEFSVVYLVLIRSTTRASCIQNYYSECMRLTSIRHSLLVFSFLWTPFNTQVFLMLCMFLSNQWKPHRMKVVHGFNGEAMTRQQYANDHTIRAADIDRSSSLGFVFTLHSCIVLLTKPFNGSLGFSSKHMLVHAYTCPLVTVSLHTSVQFR